MSKAQEWRAKAREAAKAGAVELELPSGMVIWARRPNPLQFAAWGKLPLGLAVGGTAPESLTAEEVAEVMEFMRLVLEWCCVDPRISLDPVGPEEIHPREIPWEDATFVYRWAMRAEEARNLEGFRGERTDAGGGGNGGTVCDQTF